MQTAQDRTENFQKSLAAADGAEKSLNIFAFAYNRQGSAVWEEIYKGNWRFEAALSNTLWDNTSILNLFRHHIAEAQFSHAKRDPT